MFVNRFSASWLVRDAVETVNPGVAAEIDALKANIRPLDMVTLRLLERHSTTLEELDIHTPLSPEMVDIMVSSELGDREVADRRAHDARIAKIHARGPVWAEAVKMLGALVLGFIIGHTS